MNLKEKKMVAVIVAHPDDETLWAGGTILSHPLCNWYIVCLCGGSDPDRASRFIKAIKALRAEGAIGDLDDGTSQAALNPIDIQRTILELLPPKHYDVILTHNPAGEYTRHIRHEEVSRAVINLWNASKISTRELWSFAYVDGDKEYYPRPDEKATFYRILTPSIWKRKFNIITKTYGFEENSFEAETSPQSEAFWQFTEPSAAKEWMDNGGKH